MSAASARKLPLSTLLAGALVLVVGFGYGAVAARKELFPYPQLRAAFRRVSPAPSTPGSPNAPEAPGAVLNAQLDTGWWEIVRRPGGAGADDILEDMAKVGYLQGYEPGGDEVGVTVHDPERAQPGLNLIVSAHEPEVLLADMEGETLHSWRFDYEDLPPREGWEPPGTFGARYFRRAGLLDDGELLALYETHGLVRLDRDSNLVWGRRGYFHHDFDVTDDGRIFVLTGEMHLLPRIHETRETFEDFVVELDLDGSELRRVSLLEAFESSPYASMMDVAPDRSDIFHTNTLEIFDGRHADLSPLFEAGKALISVWGLDAIAIVDLEEVEVEWALTGMWHRQHQPTLLENGNMLVFDNLGHHGMSKVIEIEPFTQRIVWAYEGNAENDFLSTLCGSNQRLANGDTLVTESLSGRAFEVTPEGDVVWRWASPYRVGPNGEGVAVLMELIRIEEPLDWLE